MYYVYTFDDGRTFYHDDTPPIGILYLFMYLIGVGVYFVFYRIYHIFCGKRKKSIDGGAEKSRNFDKEIEKSPRSELKELGCAVIIFLIIDFVFCFFMATDKYWATTFFLGSIQLGFPFLAASVAVWIRHIIKKEERRAGAYQQATDDLSQDGEEWENIIGENESSHEPKPPKQLDLRNTVLENMKRFLLEPGNDFLLIDEEYNHQSGKGAYHPDLLLYHMKLKCHVAVDLKLDDFKPEYLNRMDTYLETLDRDVKKPDDNPSAGIILCKNAKANVVEYSLNKDLSQEMAIEYKTNLIDKKVLNEKLNELYGKAKENNMDSDT